MAKIKVLELFSGIGACSKALTNLGIDHEIVDAVEIDKYAIKSFNAIHGTNFEPQDITKWDKDIDVDLIMHGSPCQDFSVAGKGAGGDKESGTRSSLMYETLRIVEKLKPKYVIWENVKNLLSAKHRQNFDAYLERMAKLGYKNYYQVLNAKDFGVPQNRERVFTVSIRLDVPYCWAFKFPTRRPLTKRLKDVLEANVGERYYLSDEQVLGLINSNYDQNKRFYKVGGVSPTISTMSGGQRQPKIVEPFVVASRGRNPDNPSDRTPGSPTIQRLEPRLDGCTNTLTSVQKDNYIAIKTANKTGYDLATDGDGIDLAYPDSKTRRGRVSHGVSKTLPTSDSQGVMDGYRIRKLTPLECWRLMGFDDTDFHKAEKVNSNTQLYKQAGNSIVVNVLMAILKGLYGSNDK
jgi:DNA (cytosine-5)-methyltransferase 1